METFLSRIISDSSDIVKPLQAGNSKTERKPEQGVSLKPTANFASKTQRREQFGSADVFIVQN